MRVVNLHSSRCGRCTNCSNSSSSTADSSASSRTDSRWCLRAEHFYSTTVDGAYASFVLCKAGSLVEIPSASLSFVDSCFLMCTAAVAYRALVHHAHMRPGERVLVTGASGGVGIHAIQIVKALGAVSIALTSIP